MAPIPHIQKKPRVQPTVSVSTDDQSAYYRRLERKMKRQKQELMDYADAIDVDQSVISIRLENLGTPSTEDLETLQQSLQQSIDSISDRVTALEEEEQEPHQQLQPAEP